MTIVVAYKFLTSALVIADCRASVPSEGLVYDNLQKIYQVGNRLVLGFAGPIGGAVQVLDAVRRHAEEYSKPPIADNLLRDVARWIRYAYRQIDDPEYRKHLSFVLASVEPRRERRSTWRSAAGKTTSKPRWFPYRPELRVVALEPRKSDPAELVQTQWHLCGIIGVQDAIRDEVRTRLEKMYGFAWQQPEIQARCVVDSLMVVLMEKHLKEIGGLFQCALLNTKGIQWLTYRSPGPASDVSLCYANGRFIQKDNITGREVPLKAAWEWWSEWQTIPRGARIVFEDPSLRTAVDGQDS